MKHGFISSQGAYKVTGSNVEEAWKTLFQDMQVRLAERLKTNKSFCTGKDGRECAFCARHRSVVKSEPAASVGAGSSSYGTSSAGAAGGSAS